MSGQDSSVNRYIETLEGLLLEIEDFEADESRPDTGTGSRREGSKFEELVDSVWFSLAGSMSEAADQVELIQGHPPFASKNHWWLRIKKGGRSIYFPTRFRPDLPVTEHGREWLQTVFQVEEMLSTFPGRTTAIRNYSPDFGPFASEKYFDMFSGLTTKFDGTILLEENGVLVHKWLLEYKTAKSSRSKQIDGNAHERLSFQVMQYLEIATRFPKCSLAVLANGAFARYRNKYHPNFRVQADRLKAFSWFEMRHMSSSREYSTWISEFVSWWLRK